MKKLFLSFALLAASVLVGVSVYRYETHKLAGYNVGGCSPSDFMGAHLEVNNDEAIVTEIATGPKEVQKLDKPIVYKFTKTDEQGYRHYVAVKGNLEIVIVKRSSAKIIGAIEGPNGELAAVVFGVAGNESQLADAAVKEFEVCMQLLQTGDDSVLTN